jgi:hypothetical protein
MRLAWGLGAAVLALSVAGGMSTGAMIATSYWGYVIGVPPMLPEVGAATAVRRFTLFHTTPAGAYVVSEAAAATPDEIQRIAANRQYWIATERLEVLGKLRERFADAPADATLDLGTLFAALRAEKIVLDGSPGYWESGRWLSGVAIELADAGGEPLLLLMANSGQVENDHYARYEVLLTRPGSTWNSHRWQRYFQDVAGLEMFEGPVLFVLASVAFTVIYGVVLGLVAAAVGILVALKRRVRRREPAVA